VAAKQSTVDGEKQACTRKNNVRDKEGGLKERKRGVYQCDVIVLNPKSPFANIRKASKI
jgi:hypothetical protein